MQPLSLIPSLANTMAHHRPKRSSVFLALLVLSCCLLHTSGISSVAPSSTTAKPFPIFPVQASDRVSANQGAQGDRSIKYFTVNLPGRTLVTYASDLPCNLDVEVTVSSSSEDVVAAVNVGVEYDMLKAELQ